MKYSKHQIRRIRDLNDKYFEVLFNKRGLNFVPGSSVTLYNGIDTPIFLASGIQEPWTRIILNRDLFSPNFPQGTVSIKLNLEVDNPLPTLMTEQESPAFVLTSEMVSPFFSYVSTYPHNKCKVCYLGADKISEDWIKTYHKLVDVSKIKKEKNLYVMGDREVLEGKARKVINKCKSSYLV